MNETIFNTWRREGYRVEEQDFDYDLHKLVVISDEDELLHIIYPNDVDDLNEMIEDLDYGLDVRGWADGQGGVVEFSLVYKN